MHIGGDRNFYAYGLFLTGLEKQGEGERYEQQDLGDATSFHAF
jgi:hypothetical protein